MADNKNGQNPKNSISKSPNQSSSDWESTRGRFTKAGQAQYPNPPETTNPDPATLREQWRFAIRQYSKWYSHAWGTAILAGVTFFALGWFVKGSNPLPSLGKPQPDQDHRSKD